MLPVEQWKPSLNRSQMQPGHKMRDFKPHLEKKGKSMMFEEENIIICRGFVFNENFKTVFDDFSY